MPTIRFVATGRVQGVWYRAFTERTATALSLAGWVRNRADGTVEGVAEGPQASLDALVAALREGPPAAIVDDVHVEDHAPVGTIGFRVVKTA